MGTRCPPSQVVCFAELPPVKLNKNTYVCVRTVCQDLFPLANKDLTSQACKINLSSGARGQILFKKNEEEFIRGHEDVPDKKTEKRPINSLAIPMTS